MKTLRMLASALVLSIVLVLPAFAGQTDSPPCAAPVPGQTDSPPCQGITPGNTDGSANLSTATAADEALAEIMTEVLESMLSFY